MFEYKEIGKIEPKLSADIAVSPIGIGFEKLDRDVFDPEPCYEYLGKSGAKWARIQSGWAKTEKVKGQYDFAWLDSIVDNLIAQGLTPWVCLCYGNGIYDERCAGRVGGIGCPPVHDDVMKKAWTDYCTAIAKHYSGRVKHYEVWNEPDGQWCWKHGVNAKEYGEFARATSVALHEGNSDVVVFAGSFCTHDLSFLNTALKEMSEHIDFVTFHNYGANPEYWRENGVHSTPIEQYYKQMRALIDMYDPNIGIIMGETGCHSEFSKNGAVNNCNWTPEKQAKLLLRRLSIDVLCGAEFSSYFSCADMYENLAGADATKNHSEYGFYGVLGERFENGIATGEYYPKPSFYALQNIATVFAGAKVCELPIEFRQEHSQWWSDLPADHKDLKRGCLELADGRKAFIYWIASDILTQTVDAVITVRAFNMGKKPQLYDLMSGKIYEIPDQKIQWLNDTDLKISHMKITDHPMMLVF